MRGTRRRVLSVIVALAAVALVAACEPPPRPSVGRGTPVKRVLLIGDSITHGLFGTTPRVHEELNRRLAERGIHLSIGGFAGENPVDPWFSNPRWIDVMNQKVAAENPDMIIIQTMLFPDAGLPERQAAYRVAIRDLIASARSRGAHVYLVKHPTPLYAKEQLELAVAERLQGEAGAGKGISWIPLDKWIGACKDPYSRDGWHLSGNGQRCHADAVTAAVDQLRAVNG